ncbi:hypothetical protein [Dyadobacter sp. CY347]|uniref:hypothetical protein n=1 Tax=Dyadobacter sp. CY347 TaxID=2909336 RepID=UPI001F3A67BE|nr:hypothetical protein [Dyadobacter sp. CY347]MCF2490848.1 hypothetical protein [Dyadobacter sp. CY347]
MQQDELDQMINYILPIIQYNTDDGQLCDANQVLATGFGYNRQQVMILVDTLLEQKLVTSGQKAKTLLRITPHGTKIVADGGWHIYLERKQRLEEAEIARQINLEDEMRERQRREDDRAEQNLRIGIATARAAKNSGIAAWGSVFATVVSFLFSVWNGDNEKAKAIEIASKVDSLKMAVSQLNKEMTILQDTVPITSFAVPETTLGSNKDSSSQGAIKRPTRDR